jgi:Alfin
VPGVFARWCPAPAEVEDLYEQCDPERENLCLYGAHCSCIIHAIVHICGPTDRVRLLALPAHMRRPTAALVQMPSAFCRHRLPQSLTLLRWIAATGESDGSWAVDLPAEEVPAELPEPCLGINFARNGMQQRDWLALVAVHSDAWLLSVAFYYGGLRADIVPCALSCKCCRGPPPVPPGASTVLS